VIYDDIGAQDTQGFDADSPTIVNSPILLPTQPMAVIGLEGFESL
jgi:hypothetical protein